MKKIRKIKLSHIGDSKLEEEQIHLKGGYNPCYPCEGCVGAGSYTQKSIAKYESTWLSEC